MDGAKRKSGSLPGLTLVGLVSALLSACGGQGELLPAVELGNVVQAPLYQIGSGDQLTIFVWQHPDLTTTVPVRPDGRVTLPLLEDIQAIEQTPAQLARRLETELAEFIRDPLVTVMVGGFAGSPSQQVRILGAAALPQAFPFRANMTLLDIMVQVGGLTEFANGNRAILIRSVDGEQREYQLLLDDLVKQGDISANVAVLPGDVIIIPERFL